MSAARGGEQPPPPRRARLARYAWWQLHDYLFERGAPTLLICLLFGYMGAGPIRAALQRQLAHPSAELIAKYGSMEVAQQALLHDTSAAFLRTFLGAIVFLAALLATNGIVANDRKQGYYRLLFAKPQSPTRYYGQAFLVHWAGVLGVLSVLTLVYGYFITPVLSVVFLATLGLMYFCYAGIAFALSAVARWDWLSLVTVTVAASYFWERYGPSPSAWSGLLYLLPPLHRTAEVYDAVAGGVTPPWQTVAWFTGYGAVSFGIGLVVLRFRRLAVI
jgi:ABC-type transport system involved in multi-copper enzyme maturation permease subunit